MNFPRVQMCSGSPRRRLYAPRICARSHTGPNRPTARRHPHPSCSRNCSIAGVPAPHRHARRIAATSHSAALNAWSTSPDTTRTDQVRNGSSSSTRIDAVRSNRQVSTRPVSRLTLRRTSPPGTTNVDSPWKMSINSSATQAPPSKTGTMSFSSGMFQSPRRACAASGQIDVAKMTMVEITSDSRRVSRRSVARVAPDRVGRSFAGSASQWVASSDRYTGSKLDIAACASRAGARRKSR